MHTDQRKPATPSLGAAVFKLIQTLRSIQISRGECPWFVLNLTMAQLKAMMLVAQTGGVRSRELGDGLGIAPSAVTPLVDRLVQQKLVARHDDPLDRRIIWIRPTPKGMRLHDELTQTNQRILDDVFKKLPPNTRPEVLDSILLLQDAADRVLEKKKKKTK